MKVEYLRASSCNDYDNCEFAYYLNYSIGFGSEAGIKAAKGTIVHKVGELLAKASKVGRNKRKTKYTDVKYLLDIVWKRNKQDFPQFTFDEDDYEDCLKWSKIIVNSKLSPLKRKVLAIELQFEIEMNIPGFQYEENGVKKNCLLRGTIDLITEEDGETLHVIDYKTGKRLKWIGGGSKELDDFRKDNQCRIYDLALAILFPQYKYRMITIYFINDGGPFTVEFSDKDRLETIDSLRKYFNKIKVNSSPTRLKDKGDRAKDRWKCKKVCYYGMTNAKSGIPLCDSYYGTMKYHGYEKVTTKLTQLSISAKNKKVVSARNDYSRNKIMKVKFR